MGENKQPKGEPSQRERFENAARELGTDDDPERFKETVRKIAKAHPVQSEPSKGKAKPK